MQVDKWVRQGVIEVDAGQALLHMAEDPNALADLKSTWFVLFGATSAMGPLEILLSMGATVVAIDLDRGSIWKNILKKGLRANGSKQTHLLLYSSTLRSSFVRSWFLLVVTRTELWFCV